MPKLKRDDQGKAVLTDDGRPVYVWEDGKEQGVDVDSMFGKIKELSNEARTRREAADAIAAKIKILDGIDDLEAWKRKADEALDTIQNLKDQDLVKAGEVEKVKAGLKESYEAKMAEMEKAYKGQIEGHTKTLSEKDQAIRRLLIKGAFDSSKFLAEKTVLPSDMAFASFGHLFDVEEINGDLRAVAKNAAGDKIFSRIKPGEYASPEEAIEQIVADYPYKDRILKAGPGGGSGSTGNTNPNTGGHGKLTPEQVGKLSPAEYMEYRKKGLISGST